MAFPTAVNKIVVIGAGTMGQGIAQVCAMWGCSTTLYDIKEAMLDKAKAGIERNLDKGIEKGKVTEAKKAETLSHLSFSASFEDLVGDIIIEAIIENLAVKQELFSKLEAQNNPEAIFATNTSSIPVTRIGTDLQHPERLVGLHFFNPVHIMKLVEIISGAATSPRVAQQMYDFAKALGKQPVMAEDAPGFIVNRVARHFYVEGLKVLEEGVADVGAIDRLVESAGFRMGPFRLMDLIGVDTNFSVTTSMFNAFHQDPKFRPSRIQEQKVDAGHHGRKTGKGFYSYE